MKVSWNVVWYVVLTLMVLGLIKFCGRDIDKVINPEYWENPNFKTDTQYISVPYDSLVIDSFEFKVPAATIIKYLPSEIKYIGLEVNDSLLQVIDSLNGKITTINNNYLKLYPSAPKFINGTFARDTLSLDLLHTSGEIQTQIYPVNYSRFKYQFINSEIRAEEIENSEKEIPKKKIYSNGLYGHAGYSVFEKKPIVSLDYQVRYKKIQLSLSNTLLLSQIPTMNLEAKIGYRLK